MRTVDLPKDKLDALLDAFSYLKHTHFVLKWELPDFEGSLPANVMLNSWLPQQEILGKVLAF